MPTSPAACGASASTRSIAIVCRMSNAMPTARSGSSPKGIGKSRVRARMIDNVPRENSEDRLRGKAGADPVERIQDQVRDGIDAEIIFPNKGLMMFATKDAAFGMAQCKVWNDFAWEMYGQYNDFMSPAAAIMTSDVELAIEEIKRVAKIGFRFLTLPCKPVFGGHDSRDPNYNLTCTIRCGR